jgi:uncharacterized protein YegP (UPF0339 family)
MNDLIWVDIYQGKRLLRQSWRWRVVNAGNGRVMGHGGEAYTNKADCITAVTQLFGDSATVWLREPEQQNVLLRRGNA